MKTYLAPSDIENLLQAAKCQRDALLILITYRLGCRISETLGLEPQHIDFLQGTVTIQHLKSRIQLACPKCNTRLGKNHSFCPKCGQPVQDAIARAREQRKMRTIPLDSDTLKQLQYFIAQDGPVQKGEKTLIFGINRHRAWQIITECAQRAGLFKLINPESGKVHNISPHKLRDAFAVNAMKKDDSGDGLRLLQQHLGHANFNTTAKYRKVSGEEHREWYQKLWGEVNS